MTRTLPTRRLTRSPRDRFLAFDTEVEAAVAAPTLIPKPDELGWWEWAVFLLHTATEIEHALLVQYLYASFSLADSGFAGTAIPPNATELAVGWQGTILEIAEQEMGHLITEQNLLLLIDAPLSFQRQELPFLSNLYPFPFALEPLSKDSLATYVAAERPATPAIPPAELAEIIARATGAEGGMPVNRVGMLFDTLHDVFADPAKLLNSDFRTPTDEQADPDEWEAFAVPDMIVKPVANRGDALDAITRIGDQGEGSGTAAPGTSHFERFLAIYRQFPDTSDPATATWIPTRPVPSNPNTLPDPSTDPTVEEARITDPVSRLWAQLFDVRYHMLLAALTHAMLLAGPYTDPVTNTSTPRGQLRDWAFNHMGSLAGIAAVLVAGPRDASAGRPLTAAAGPPFQMPTTLMLAAIEHGRWRLHKALLDSSAELIARLTAKGVTGQPLASLLAADNAAAVMVNAQLAMP